MAGKNLAKILILSIRAFKMIIVHLILIHVDGIYGGERRSHLQSARSI
jgi:uncharacterized membrane protein